MTLVLASLGFGLPTTALAQTAATSACNTMPASTGKTLFCANGTKTCNTAGCHQNASATFWPNNINRGTNPSTIQAAAMSVGSMQPIFPGGISDADANALATFISAFLSATGPTPPTCTVSASPSSTVTAGTSVTLTASCTNSPTSYAWTNCSSTSATCTTTSPTATSRSISVTASNSGGPSAPASITVTWQAAAPQPPSCTVSSSNPTPTVGSSITLTASCTNSPTSYAWTGCTSTGATCTATAAAAGAATYSVIATNAGGNGTASTSVTWQSAAGGGGLVMPTPLGFGNQPVGTTSSPLTATISNAGTTAVTITNVTNDNTAEFSITENTCTGTLAGGGTCRIALTFRPSAAGTRSANIGIVNSASASPAQFLAFGAGQAGTTTSANYTGLYWNAPGGSEDGWGINVAHQGDIVFMTWFTYDASGKDWWLIMVGTKTAEGVFTGSVSETRGNPFNAVPFNPTGGDPPSTAVGTATLNFVAPGGPTFSYTVNGVSKTKTIALQQFATAPVASCTFGSTAQASATNYTDLWWATRTENGWGINLTHQGDVVFGTWFTYGMDGKPMWLFTVTTKSAPGVYTGLIYRSTGTPFTAATYSKNDFKYPSSGIGTMKLTFADGAHATMEYTVNGIAPAPVTQTKSLVRQTLVPPGIVCQ
jgi:hypothetical protein